MFSMMSKKLTIEDIRKIEVQIGLKLPLQLVEHYLQYNGGVPDRTYFYSEEADIETNVQTFLPFRYVNEIGITIEDRYVDYRNRKIMPEKLLPFASDAGGNKFCIDIETGQIYIVWLDLGEVTKDCIVFLAEDFNEFMNKLDDDEDEDDEDEV